MTFVFSHSMAGRLSSIRNKKQAGFTLVELLVVAGILGLLIVFAAPRVQSILYAKRAENAGLDIVKLVNKMHTTFASGGNTPYGAVDTSVCANALNVAAQEIVVTGVGAAAVMSHNFGATGATITCAPGTITAANDAVVLTLNDANRAACPDLAGVVARSVDVIAINGTNVKANGANYQGGTAINACTEGDTNDYVFTFK